MLVQDKRKTAEYFSEGLRESIVIGYIIQSARIPPDLKEEDFELTRYKLLFRAIKELSNEGRFLTISEIIAKVNELGITDEIKSDLNPDFTIQKLVELTIINYETYRSHVPSIIRILLNRQQKAIFQQFKSEIIKALESDNIQSAIKAIINICKQYQLADEMEAPELSQASNLATYEMIKEKLLKQEYFDADFIMRNFGVSRITAFRIIRKLKEEGKIVKPRKGLYVPIKR